MRCDDTDEERAEAWSSLFVDFGNDHGPLIEAWDGRMGMAVIDCLCDVRIPCFLPMLLTHMPFFVSATTQQKNTCAHNNTNKAHRNGIKKAKKTKYVNTQGMDPKFLRNQKFAKKYNGSKRVHND